MRRFVSILLAVLIAAGIPSVAGADEGAQLTSIGPVKVWVGLKNSDDVGTKFDLLAQVYKDDALVTSGHLDNAPGGGSGFNNAVLRSIALDPFMPVDFPAGSQFKLRLYVRNACLGPTHNSGTARLWYADAAANSRFDATVGTATTDYYLHNTFLLGTAPGPGPRKSIDVAAGAPCSAFKTFGAWTAVTSPGAPQSVIAIGANREATVSWSAPANGGSPITSYAVTASPGGATVTSTSTTVTVTGLEVGTAYTFTVTATNALGTGPASPASNPATTWDYPAAPQTVTATAGTAAATISWLAPPSDGGSPVTSYTVTPYTATTPLQPTTVDGLTLSAIVTGLTSGGTYTFAVAATSIVGSGSAGTSPAVTLGGTVPGVPQSVTATAGNAQATVSWQAPSSDGGTPVTGYTVTVFIGSAAQLQSTVDTLSTTITGLVNGTAYTFTVSATNAVGTGPASTSPAVTPSTVPGTPQNATAAPGDGRAIVSWQPPASDGGSPVTGYVITALLGGVPQSTTNPDASAVSVSVGGLTNGTAYTFTVTATNAVGTGPAATASTVPSGLPTAPLDVSATIVGADRVTVSWQPPAYDGDSPITSYVVTPLQGTTALTPVTATASPVIVTGLSGNTTYTFRVAATNANSTGPSATSAAVTTPQTPCPVPGATNVWTGAAGSTAWNTAANWSAARVPNSTDVACLPAGTPGTTAISVPTTTVKRLISYKLLTIPNGFTTTEGADFEANATWTNGTLTGPSITIGIGATVVINGQLTLAGSIAITNAGTVSFVNGLFPANLRSSVSQPCGAGNTASWTNTGTLVFSDTASQSFVNLCGTFSNTASGTVTRSVGGSDSLAAGQLVNAGLIDATLGRLNLSSASGAFTGGRLVAAPGKIVLGGTFTASASATIGDNVWVVGTGAVLTGTVVIPAGATVHAGYDPTNLNASNVNGVIGTISGEVTGAGTLSVTGYIFFNPGFTNIGTATVAADLRVAHVSLGDYVTLAAKPDGTPTQIGSGSTVAVGGRVTMAGTVAIVNEGTIDITVGSHTLNSQSLIGGLAGSACSGGTGPSLTNVGVLTLSDAGGASVTLCSLINSGIISHSGTGRANLGATQLTTTGTVTVPSGSLQWSVGTGLISGGSVAGGNGQLIMTNGITTATDATVGDNVWVVGAATLTGTIVIPAGATVHVGYNPALEVNVDGPAGVISGTVNGAGALNAIGHLFHACGTCSIGNTATAVVAADLNVPTVALGDYATLAIKPDGTAVVIGSGTSVVSNGDVRLAASTTVVNNGTVDLAVGTHLVNGDHIPGGLSSRPPCLASDASSWVNNGTVKVSDLTGSARFAVCGTFLNGPGGTVRHTGTGKNTLSASQLTNEGTIESTAGILVWSSTNGLFAGGLVSGTAGQIHLIGTTTATADALVGNNVWVLGSGTLTGTIVIPVGATVHIGHNTANPTDVNGVSGTVSGLVTGAGTLTAIGQVFNHFPNGNNTATPLIAADLHVAHVILADLTLLGIKPDGTPTTIGSGAIVTLVEVPTLAAGLQLHNHGTLDFGTNGYFNCATCTLINNGSLKLDNPDGSFTHSFVINTGTFDNEGLILLAGYLPGTSVVFAPNVTLVGAGAGQARFESLVQPTWIQNLQSDATVVAVANALTQPGLTGLGRNTIMAAIATIGNVGVGQCTNVNLNVNALLGVGGASMGVCVIVDPAGEEVIALTISGGLGGGVSWPSGGSWSVQNLFGASVSLDAGAQVMWRAGDSGGRGFDVHTDIEGPAWCQNGTLSPALIGGTGQHCWSPTNLVPFQLQLNTLPVTEPSVHSFYFGPVVGSPGFSLGATFSYSVPIGCSRWNQLTLQTCPPDNITPPEVGGTPAVGQTLTVVNDGTWTMASNLTYGYQWLRCASSTGSCSAITGATSNTYQVTTADRNFWLTARVTATNQGGGSQSATAARIGPVP